jgi:hypothetical protein
MKSLWDFAKATNTRVLRELDLQALDPSGAIERLEPSTSVTVVAMRSAGGS